MRILMLTWEFPPYITGGLGMACYGIVKALLSLDVEIDLVLPTVEDVYFPMRKPEDADIMPIKFLDISKNIVYKTQTTKNLKERLSFVGVTKFPESYLTPGYDFKTFMERFFDSIHITEAHFEQILKLHLHGDDPLFKKVQEYMARVVSYAQVFSQCDIIHAHDWLTYPTGLVLRKMLNRKLISHIHATEFDRAGGPGDERIHNIEYAGLINADRVMAVSQYTARMIIDRYRVEPRKIRIVHNAYSVGDTVSLEKKKLFKDPLVLFMGRITLQKGPDYFIDVAERVLKRFPNVRFVMAGTGDMFSRMLKSSASKRLKDRFLFAGFLNREQVEKILSATDIFVLPSVSEPFGIVPLEAMAFGAATIVSKQSGVAEVVNNVFKVNFWDVDRIADTIVGLLDDPVKRQKIAEAGQKEVFAMGWNNAARNLKRSYEEILCSM